MSSAPSPDKATMPDLSACEREPIHIPGSIEPNGALLVLKEPELTVVQASANVGRLLGAEAEALLGTELSRLVEPTSFSRLQSNIASENLDRKRRYLADIRLSSIGRRFDASFHRHDGALIIELEPEAEEDAAPGELHSALTDAIAALDGRLSLAELCQRVAAQVRHLTGFDRVMVYRFLEDDTGWVVAEERRHDLTPYLGLRYPASDIPAQARRLYLLNPVRLKADVNAVRVPLVPALTHDADARGRQVPPAASRDRVTAPARLLYRGVSVLSELQNRSPAARHFVLRTGASSSPASGLQGWQA